MIFRKVILFLHRKGIAVCTVPNISVSNWIAMVLQSKVTGFSLRTAYFHIILNQNAIMQNRISTLTNVFSILIEDRSMNNDIVSLPNTGCPTGIYQWRIPIINSTRLSMGISRIIVRVQNLYLWSTQWEKS